MAGLGNVFMYVVIVLFSIQWAISVHWIVSIFVLIEIMKLKTNDMITSCIWWSSLAQ